MKLPSTGKSGGRGRNTGRKSRSTYVTKSGQTIKLNQKVSQKWKAFREEKARKKAERLAGMPKSRVKRFFYRLHPVRLYKYWFSREGAIMALKLTGIGALAGFLILVGIFAYFRKDLPNLKDISGSNIGGSNRYYDRTGKTLLWEDDEAVKRIPVEGDKMSDYIKHATIAIEDKDFYRHGGFDIRGIMRATFNNAFGSGGTQGGSTITQQLVKLNNDWSDDRTITRKIKELILSVDLERTYSKKDILERGYLNTAPYGGVLYGVEAASQDYFGKPAKKLTIDEAAMLAAIPKSPAYFAPRSQLFEKIAFEERQDYIINLMKDQGYINEEEATKAKEVNTLKKIKPRQSKYVGIKAPWFVLTAKEQLEVLMQDKTTINKSGWKITTTVDLKLQEYAENAVKNGMGQVQAQGGDVAAFVAEDVKSGQVVALVGGPDFRNKTYGENNYARYKLPPGSSYKPYDYASVIEHTDNFGAGTVLYDTLGPIDGYPCTTGARKGGNCAVNYDFRFPGPVTLRYALGGSRNVPAMKAMLIAGVDKTLETSQRLMTNFNEKGQIGDRGKYACYEQGDETLTKETQCYTSAAIGDGSFLRMDEHVHGYATLSRNGNNIPQRYIIRVEDSNGREVGKWVNEKGVQAVRPDTAYIVTDMLSDPNASYFPRKPHRYNGWKFGLKTGTTNDGKDGWMMGLSSRYAAGVWVGYHNRQRVMSGFMETMTEPIWSEWMKKAHDPLKPEDWQRPSGVQEKPAFVIRSHVGLGSVEPSRANDLFPSWYKDPKKAANKKQTIDIVSKKLATECTPERAKKEQNSSNANSFSGDIFVNARTSTDKKDDIHKCTDIKPTITLSQGSGSTLVAAVVAGTHKLSSSSFKGTVNFIIDGQIKYSTNISSSGSVTWNYAGKFTGKQKVTAQIIDSVLYDATSNAVSVTGVDAVATLVITTAKMNGVNPKFEWTGGSGTVTIYKASDDSILCSDVAAAQECQGGSAITGDEVYAKDTKGNESDPATIAP
jgi:penicillin-binding protein 1A